MRAFAQRLRSASRAGTFLCAALLLACASAGRPGPARHAAAAPIETGELSQGTHADADTLLVDLGATIPGIAIDMRYRDANNFTGAPLPGYEANRALMRREAAAALARVQRDVSDSGWTLKVFDAYRPVRATEAMVAWTRRAGREDLVRDGYIASRSRHNMGVAIDLTLADRASGAELDMGTAFDTFSAAAHTANAAGDVARNRRRLVSAMERHGFANYAQEWWHFSYPVERPLRFDVVIR
jgi:D-alanyl-D-alanine dipeptidase